MRHSPAASYRRSGRNVVENLIAETSTCSLITRVPLTSKGWSSNAGWFPLPNLISKYPLGKIFGDRTVRLTDFTHVSGRHYDVPPFYPPMQLFSTR
jgi:hypothetical protein